MWGSEGGRSSLVHLSQKKPQLWLFVHVDGNHVTLYQDFIINKRPCLYKDVACKYLITQDESLHLVIVQIGW
jgi:hypothetical protein